MKATVLNFIAKLYPMAKRGLYRFKGGVFPRYNKSLSKQHPVHTSFIPNELVLPLHQHVGIETEPKVSVGDKVLKNQCLAESKKGLSAPVHAPTSGEIIAIEQRTLPHPSGLSGVCIVLKPDHQDQAIDNVLEVDGQTPASPKALKEIVYRAGIVGMGGAGFPTFAKIPDEKGKIHTLLINGAECEPFITCDDVLMQTHPEAILRGAEIVAEALGCKRIICGIEDNKPEAITAMQAAVQKINTPSLADIQPVPTVYPMGGQKQLTRQLIGIEVPAHAHAVDVGLIMMNVATLAAIFQAVKQGTPLTSRLVTVSGLGLANPFNIEAMIGTDFNTLVELAEPKSPINYPLVHGGPMMGFEMPSNHVPVIKTTNCILANPPQPTEMVMPCIRCGECMDACPVNLLPQQLYWHARSHEFDKAEKLNLFDCIECGCCSFVCPSHIPLVQYYRYAKGEVKKNKQETLAAQHAKERHEAKLAREERIKQQREAKLKAKKEAVKRKAAAEATGTPQKTTGTTEPSKQKAPSAAAAAARAAAARKKSGQNNANQTTETNKPTLSARDKAIAAARKRTENAAAKKTDKVSSTQNDTDQAKASKTSTETDTKTKARQAAQKRAQAAAAAKQRAKKAETQAETTPTKPSNEVTAPSETKAAETSTSEPNTQQTDAPIDKRKAAMEAARKRAAARKKTTDQTSGED